MDSGLQIQIGVVVAILIALWVLPDWNTYRDRATRLGRWLGLLAVEPEAPSGPPVERSAADAERIRSAIQLAPPETPVARMRGWSAAYDDVLVIACRALDREQSLESLPRGSARDFERERVERMLVRAGLLTGPYS